MSVTCDFCGKTTSGGITRAKRHQMGLRGDVNICKKTPTDVKNLLKEAMEKKKGDKEAWLTESLIEEQDEQDDVYEIFKLSKGKRPATAATGGASLPPTKKPTNVKGPIDVLLWRDPETTLALAKNKKQTSMNDACIKEARAKTVQYITRYFCWNAIAFNVVRSRSFRLMVEAIGNYGPNLKLPSYHEMRVPLLKKELEHTNSLMKPHVDERVAYGCSIMSDAWTDRKNRTLINFLVNCPTGSMFVKSIDASSYVKSGEKLFQLLDSFVEEIGESNVVQLVSDNGSNYVLAGKLLQAKRPNMFWTPCAAHCLDLMLEDIGKIPRIKRAIQRGINLMGFIYNHTLVLNTMRKFTSKAELVRCGVTRFAMSFLTLQRLHNQKNNLRKMFTSDDWLKSKTAKEPKGKKAADVVLMPMFWNDVIFTLKAMGPLVRVLRLVDNEKKPAMGYIYEAMDRAKEAIQNAFNGDESKYKEICEIIDKRWECQLHHPLHAAGHFLNPEFFYNNPAIEPDHEVVQGLHICIERLSANDEAVDKITNQLSKYKSALGLFGIRSAARHRTTMAPAEWWRNYGSHCPDLMQLAIKVLSLTCSASGCERNWSIFEHYGRIMDIELKIPPRPPCYCFVEFDNARDAEDAIRGRDGYNFDGCRLRVELAHGGRGPSSSDRRGYGGGGGGGSGGGGRFGVSRHSEYRVIVRGLPSSASWQDLKDHMRKAGDVCFAEVTRDSEGTFGLVDYTNYDDMKYAIRKLDDTEFRNPWARSYIRVRKYESSRSRSRSRSPRSPRSPSRSISPKRNRSRSLGRSVSRSRSRSRSASPIKSSRPRSRSRSGSPRQVLSGSG